MRRSGDLDLRQMAKKKKDLIPIVVVPSPVVQMPLIQPPKETPAQPQKDKPRLEGRLGTVPVKPKTPLLNSATNGLPKIIRTVNSTPKLSPKNSTQPKIVKKNKNIWAAKRTVNLNSSVAESGDGDIQDEISNLLEQRQREKNNSSTEDGEINSNEGSIGGAGSKTPGTESEDDDLDLSTLVKLQQTTATFNQPIEPEIEEPDIELGEEEDSETTDDLMNSPIDPIANLPFITDFIPDYVPETVEPSLDVQRSYLEMKIKHQEQLLNCLESSPVDTPSDGPNTPDSDLEEETELDHIITRKSPFELDEVNWETFNQRQTSYFRPIRGQNQFFRDRPGTPRKALNFTEIKFSRKFALEKPLSAAYTTIRRRSRCESRKDCH